MEAVFTSGACSSAHRVSPRDTWPPTWLEPEVPAADPVPAEPDDVPELTTPIDLSAVPVGWLELVARLRDEHGPTWHTGTARDARVLAAAGDASRFPFAGSSGKAGEPEPAGVELYAHGTTSPNIPVSPGGRPRRSARAFPSNPTHAPERAP